MRLDSLPIAKHERARHRGRERRQRREHEDRAPLNGRIARHQQLARAAGPLAVAWLGGVAGYATAFAVLAGAFVIVSLVTRTSAELDNPPFTRRQYD